MAIDNFTGTNTSIVINGPTSSSSPFTVNTFTIEPDSLFRITSNFSLDNTVLYNYNQKIFAHFSWAYTKRSSNIELSRMEIVFSRGEGQSLTGVGASSSIPTGDIASISFDISETSGSFEYEDILDLEFNEDVINFFSSPQSPLQVFVSIYVWYTNGSTGSRILLNDSDYYIGLTSGCNYDDLTLHQGVIGFYKLNPIYLDDIKDYNQYELLYSSQYFKPGDQIILYGVLKVTTIQDINDGFIFDLKNFIIKLWLQDNVNGYCNYNALSDYAILNGEEAVYNLDSFLNLTINNFSGGPYIYYFNVNFQMPPLSVFNKDIRFLHLPLKLAIVPISTIKTTVQDEENENEETQITNIYYPIDDSESIYCFNLNTDKTYIYLDKVSGYNRCTIESYKPLDQIDIDNYGPEIVNRQEAIEDPEDPTQIIYKYLMDLEPSERIEYLSEEYPNGIPYSFILNDPTGDFFLFNIKLHINNNFNNDLNFIKKVWIDLKDLTQWEIYKAIGESDSGGNNYLNLFDTYYLEEWEPSSSDPKNFINSEKMYNNRTKLFSQLGILEFPKGNTEETEKNQFNYIGEFGTIFINQSEYQYNNFIKKDHQYNAAIVIETNGNIEQYNEEKINDYQRGDLVWYEANLYLKLHNDLGSYVIRDYSPAGPLWAELHYGEDWPKQEYEEDAESYALNDVVLYEGALWRATEALTPANEVPGVSNKWQYLVTLEFNLMLPDLTSTTILHLAQYSTGGLSIGKVGTSEQNNPKFECYYPAKFKQSVEFSGTANFNQPAYFQGGITGVTTYPLLAAGQTATEEQMTGGTWIDGKPIYRKVYSWSGTGSTTITLGDDLPANLDTVVSLNGMGKFPTLSRWYTFPNAYYANSNYDLTAQCNTDTGKLILHFGTTVRSSAVVHIIMEYTKTTD